MTRYEAHIFLWPEIGDQLQVISYFSAAKLKIWDPNIDPAP